jgi:uncharacterized glyoxalase superfamily protein PhnB
MFHFSNTEAENAGILAARETIRSGGANMTVVARTILLAIIGMVATGFAVLGQKAKTNEGGAKMKILRCTPIQIVDAVEPNLEFWETRMGYKRTAEVPPGAKQLDFVILEKDGLEVMLQTRKSIDADMASSKSGEHYKGNQTILYIEVDSLDEAARALKGAPIVMEPVDRPYGMRELAVKDPSGYTVCLAQQLK